MKSNKEVREMQSLLTDTQFYYSEISLSFSKLVSKKWYKPTKTIVIPSIANKKELKDIENKIEQIDVEIPSDYNTNDTDSESTNKKSNDETVNLVYQHQRKKTNGKRIPIPWTKEEINAIKVGLQKYGIGQWVKIRSLNQDIFAKNGRTSHDISDKFRSLKNKNEFKAFLKK